MSCSAVAHPATSSHSRLLSSASIGDVRRQSRKLFRLLVGKGQLLTANLQKLIADAQIGNAQLRQVTRQDHQGHILRLMAQEKAHRVMDHRIIDQMVIINDEIQRALPVGKFNKQLRKREERLAYWRFCTIASLAAQ